MYGTKFMDSTTEGFFFDKLNNHQLFREHCTKVLPN